MTKFCSQTNTYSACLNVCKYVSYRKDGFVKNVDSFNDYNSFSFNAIIFFRIHDVYGGGLTQHRFKRFAIEMFPVIENSITPLEF